MRYGRAAALQLLAVVAMVASGAGCGRSAPTPSASSGAAQPGERRLLTVDGVQRDYYVHLPASTGQHPAAVVILHGGDSDALGTETSSGFDAQADADGFIAVYPDGYQKSWADGRGKTPADQAGINDIDFLAVVIADVEKRDGADSSRIFMTGISNGGFMDFTFACRRADLVAAIAPNAASMGTSVMPGCSPSRPVSVLDIKGTADPVVPFDGGTMTGQGGQTTVVSTPDLVAGWSRLDGCRAMGAPAGWPSHGEDGTTVEQSDAQGCPAGIAVELLTVVGGGHTWPGGNQYLPVRVIGPVSHQFSAPQQIWAFLQQHGR